MAVRFISEKSKGIYAYVEYTDGKNFEVDYTYLKNVANVKKAINVEYERMNCHIVITECDGLFETAICEKTFVPGTRKNWKTIKLEEVENQPAEAEVENQPAEAEAESQPAEAEAESQPAEAEAESQPAEAEAESQPAEAESQPAAKCRYARYGKLKGRYVAIQKKIKNIDKEMTDRYFLFDVSMETNKYSIMKFADSFVGYSIAVAYILDVYEKKIVVRGKKVYTPDKRTLWIRKNDVLSKTFLDDFRK